MFSNRLSQVLESFRVKSKSRKRNGRRYSRNWNPAASATRIESLEDRTLLTVSSAFDTISGVLTVNADAADNVLVTAAGGNVLVNGLDPNSGVLAATAVLQIDVLATGNFSNTFDLSSVTPADFTNLISNRLVGAAGDDILIGSVFVDAIEGGDGNDQLIGGAGNDRYEFFLFGSGNQDDVIDETGGGIDYIGLFTESGGATLDLSIAGAQSVIGGGAPLTLTLGSGSAIEDASANFGGNLLTGNALNNRLDGGGTLIGGPGNDILSHGGGGTDDTFIGGAGDDTYEFFDDAINYGVDTIDESGGGTDTLLFEQYQTAITLNAGSTGSSQAVHANQSLIIANASTLEVLVGGAANDSLTAAPGVNTTLRGLQGDDTLIGNTGDDRLEIDEGQDTLRGAAGNDTYATVVGNLPGNDLIDESSGSGIDSIDFSAYDNFDGTGVAIDLDSNAAQSYRGGAATFSLAGVVENFAGSEFADTIDIDPLAGVTRSVDGASPTGGAPADTLNVDLMARPFTHTPGIPGNGIVDAYPVGGVGTVNYTSIESLALQNAPASAHDVYVDDDFTQLNNGEAIADADPNTAGNQPATFGIDAFATIQEGVNAVANNGTVHIIDGIYAESVAIAKPLTLNGTGPRGNIVIDPDNSGLANGITLTSGADNVTIQHLRVTDAPGNGIAAIGVANLILEDVEVDGVTTDGFHGENLAIEFTITDATFSLNGGDGIDVANSPSAIVAFTDVIATRNDPGLILNGVAAFSDTDGNYSDNADGGIVLIDVDGNVDLLRTTLNNNDADSDGTGDGLDAIDGADADSVAIAGNLTLQGVTAEDTDGAGTAQSQRHGLRIDGVAGTTTIENAPTSPGPARTTSLRNNRETGLSLTATTGEVVIRGAAMSGNDASNLIIADAAGRVSLYGGAYDDSANGGGVLIVSTGNDVVLNQVSAGNNLENGILIETASAVSLTEVTAVNNQKAGARIGDVASLSDIDGDYRGNDAHGLHVVDIAESVGLIRTRLEDNSFSGNEVGDGFHAADGPDADVNAIAGSLTIAGATIRSTGNISNHSQQRGAFVSSMGGALILDDSSGTGNTVTGNQSSGILIADGGTTATVTRGLFENNGVATVGAGIELHGFSGLVTTTQVAATGNQTGILINSVGEYVDTGSVVRDSTARGLELRDIFGNVTLTRTSLLDNTGAGLLARDGTDVGDTDAIGGSLNLQGIRVEGQTGPGQGQQTGISVDGIGVSVFVGDAATPSASSVIAGHSGTGLIIANVGSTGGLGAGAVSFVNTSITGNSIGFQTTAAVQQSLSNVTHTGNSSPSNLNQVGTLSLVTGAGDDNVMLDGAQLAHSRGMSVQDEIDFTTDTLTVTVDTGNGTDSVGVTASRAMTFDPRGGDPVSNPGGDTLTIDGDGSRLSVFADQLPGTGTGGAGPQIAYAEFENVTIANAELQLTASNTDDLLVVTASSSDSGTYQLTTDVNGSPSVGPVIGISNLVGLTFNAGAGDDKLQVINPSGGVFRPTLGTTLDAEQLEISGGQANSIVHQFARPVADYPQGPLKINGRDAYRTTTDTLTAFVTDRTSVAQRTFEFHTSAANVATLSFGIADDGDAADGESALLHSASQAFSEPSLTDRAVIFSNPSEELAVRYVARGGAGATGEHFYILGLDSRFDADLRLDGVDQTKFIVGPNTPGSAPSLVDLGTGDFTGFVNELVLTTQINTNNGAVQIRGDAPSNFPSPDKVFIFQTGGIKALGSGDVTVTVDQIGNAVDGTSIDAGTGNLTLSAADGNVVVKDLVSEANISVTASGGILSASSNQFAALRRDEIHARTATFVAKNGGIELRSVSTDFLEASASDQVRLDIISDVVIGAPGGIEGISAGSNILVFTAFEPGSSLRPNLAVAENISTPTRVSLSSVSDLVIERGAVVKGPTSVELSAARKLTVEESAEVSGAEVDINASANSSAVEFLLAGTVLATAAPPTVRTSQFADQVTIRPSATDRIPTLDLRDFGGSDTYTFHIKDTPTSSIYTISELGGAADVVIVEGSQSSESIKVTGESTSQSVKAMVAGQGMQQIVFSSVERIEVNGNAGADTVEITSPSSTNITLNGGDPNTSPGDTLIVDAGNQATSFTPHQVTVGGANPVTFSQFELTTTRNAPSLGLAGLGGNDRFTVVAKADGSTLINAAIQEPDGDGGFLPNTFSNQSFDISSDTAVSIDGAGGQDTVEFIGKRDIGTGARGTSFSIEPNGVMLDEQAIELSGIASMAFNLGSGNSVVNLDGGITVPNFISLVGDGLASTELRVDLAATAGDLRVLTNRPSRISEGGAAITEIIEGFVGGGFVELSGVGTLAIIGDGDDNVTIVTPQAIGPVDGDDVVNGLLRVSGDGVGRDTISTAGNWGRAGNWGIVTSGLDDLTIKSTTGHGEVAFDVTALSGANSYTANLRNTDVALLEGGNTLADNLVIGRYGNAWHPVGAQLTSGGPNVRVAGAGRLEVSTGGGDDTLTIDVDQTRGSDVISLPIFFDGGDGGFDTLELVGNPTTAVENMNYRPGPDTHNGRLDFEDAGGSRLMSVEFAGLEPVRNNVSGKFHSVFGTGQTDEITYSTVLATDGFLGSVKRHGQVAVGSMEVYQFLIEGVSPSPALSLHGEGGHDRFIVELPHRRGIDDLAFLNVHGEGPNSPNLENDLILLTSNGDETIEYEMNASALLPEELYVTQSGIGTPRFKLELFHISDITIPESGGADTLQITGEGFNERLEVERVIDASILQTGYQKFDVRHTEFDASFPTGLNTLTVRGVKSVTADLGDGFDEFVAVGTELGESFLVEAAQVTIGGQLSTPVSLNNHETIQIEAEGGDDTIKVINRLPIDITVNGGSGGSDLLQIEGYASDAEFSPYEDPRSGQITIGHERPFAKRDINYSGIDAIRARFDHADTYISIHADDRSNDIRVYNADPVVVDVDNRPSIQLYDLGQDAVVVIAGHAGADRFAATLLDVNLRLESGLNDQDDVATIWVGDAQYSPDATFDNGVAKLQLQDLDEIIVHADKLHTISDERVPTRSFRMPGSSDLESRLYAFVTPGSGPGTAGVRLLGSDAETAIDNPDLPSNQNGHVIAVSGGLEEHDNVFLEVSSNDGQPVHDFNLFATMVSDAEFTEETEPNNSINDDIAIIINNDHRPNDDAIIINNDHRVARRGAVPFGDTDMASIIINNDHRIAAIIINNDHRAPGVLTHSVLEILDASGETVLASGSNIQGSYGNAVVTNPLPAGQYVIRISNSNPVGDGNYELVLFDVNDDFAVSQTGRNSKGGEISPGEYGRGNISATPGKDDDVQLTPLGNQQAIIQYNQATALNVRSTQMLTIDPLGGANQLNITGTPNSDDFSFTSGYVDVNHQQFEIANVNTFRVTAQSGNDEILIDGLGSAMYDVDAGDGTDNVRFLAHRNVVHVRADGAIIDPMNDVIVRAVESVEIVGSSLLNTKIDFGLNANSATTVTSATSTSLFANTGDIDFILTTDGDIEFRSQLLNINATAGDDVINVSDAEVNLGNGLKPIVLNPIQIPISVRILGKQGRDTFKVTPSSQTAFYINGGDPIGFGDTLNITATVNSAKRLPGPSNDSGGFDVAGMKPVTYEGIEFTTLPNRPVAVLPTGSRNPTPYLEWQPVIDVVSYEVELVNFTIASDSLIAVTSDIFFQPATPLAMGRYSFRVRGIRDDGGVTEFSDPVSFDVRPRTSIAVASRVTNGTPQIQWAPVAGALRYDLWISSNDVVGPPVIRERFVTETQFTPLSELPIGRYSVYVRPHGEDGYAGTWSGTPLHIATPTTITAPTAGTLDGLPTFEWEPVAGAQTYDLWVRQLTPDAIDQVIRMQNLTETTFSTTNELPNAEFIFWVQAQGVNGFQSSWSSASRFNTFARPAIHGPTSSNAEIDSAISWSVVHGATSYDLEVIDAAGNVVINETSVMTTNFQPATLLDYGAEYSVRARAIKDRIPGVWSPVHRFLTPADRVTLIGPTETGPSEGLPPGPIRFLWNGTVGTARYELWVNQIGGPSRMVHERNLTSTEFNSLALDAGRYRFWVRALNAAGRAGVWSSAFEFTVADAGKSSQNEMGLELLSLSAIGIERPLAVLASQDLLCQESIHPNTGSNSLEQSPNAYPIEAKRRMDQLPILDATFESWEGCGT